MASAVSAAPRRWSKLFSMTYIEPRFGALAFRISDWPEMPTVCSTPGRVVRNLLDAGDDRLRPLDRGGIGQLHVQQQVAFVLLRNEAGQCAIELPIRQHKQAAVNDQRQHGDAEQPADDPAIHRNHGIENLLNQPKKPPRTAFSRSDDRTSRACRRRSRRG